MAIRERFVVKDIPRSQIKIDPRNPRYMDHHAHKKLATNLTNPNVGLIDTLVFNQRTGLLVGGHQRLSVLDEQAKGEDYLVRCAVCDLDPKEAANAMLALNNEALMGTFEVDSIISLTSDGTLDVKAAGYDSGEFALLLDSMGVAEDIMGGLLDVAFPTDLEPAPAPIPESLNQVVAQAEAIEQEAALAKMRENESRKVSRARIAEQSRTDYFLVIRCESIEEKKRILQSVTRSGEAQDKSAVAIDTLVRLFEQQRLTE